jgi:hypothetical protein
MTPINCNTKQPKQKTRQWYFARDLFCKEMQAEYRWRLERIRAWYGKNK